LMHIKFQPITFVLIVPWIFFPNFLTENGASAPLSLFLATFLPTRQAHCCFSPWISLSRKTLTFFLFCLLLPSSLEALLPQKWFRGLKLPDPFLSSCLGKRFFVFFFYEPGPSFKFLFPCLRKKGIVPLFVVSSSFYWLSG